VVSHDRDFLDGLVNKVYEFRHRKIRTHLGGIAEFLRSRKIESLRELEMRSAPGGKKSRAATGAAGSGAGGSSPAKPESPQQNEVLPATEASGLPSSQQSSKMLYLEKKETGRVYRRLLRETEQREAEISALEQEIAAMDARIAAGDSSAVNDPAFFSLYEEKKEKLDTLMQRWEDAHSELENFKTEYMNDNDNI